MKFKIAILALIALLFSCCLTSTQKTVKSVLNVPGVTTEGLEITDLEFDSLEAFLNLKVDNTNSISVEFPTINCELTLGDHSFIDGTIDKVDKFSQNKESIIHIPVKFNFRDVYAKIQEFRKLDDVDYSISDLYFRLPVFGKSANHPVSMCRLPISKPLVIDLESILLTSMESEKVNFEIMSALVKDNGFDIVLESADCSLYANETQRSNGNARHQILIAFVSVGEIPVNISIKAANMVSDVLNGQDVRYELTGKLFLRITSGFMNAVAVPFNLIGTKNMSLS